jgi:hypothetical protein
MPTKLVKRYIVRSDGIRQRYNVRISNLRKRGYVFSRGIGYSKRPVTKVVRAEVNVNELKRQAIDSLRDVAGPIKQIQKKLIQAFEKGKVNVESDGTIQINAFGYEKMDSKHQFKIRYNPNNDFFQATIRGYEL